MYKGFEDLDVWKLSMDLSKEVLNLVIKDFSKHHPLADQMTRSAISIPSNIAEGHERNSNLDFIRFLHIAKGSNAELKTQLILAKIFIEKDTHAAIDELIAKTESISKMLFRLIASLKSNPKT